MKDIKDYIHLYIGAKVMMCATHHEPQNELYVLTIGNMAEALDFGDPVVLRRLSSMTEEEAKGILIKLLGTTDIIFSEINKSWCACQNDKDLEGQWTNEEKIAEAESADYDNVLSISMQTKTLAYGCGDDMKFFVELDIDSQYINELRSLGFDCDRLIDSNLAIDSSTITENKLL